jgi:hypothetical protein
MSKILSPKTKDTVQPSLDKKIYKVKQLVNGVVNTIYIFNGRKSVDNEEELFKNIFSENESEEIKTHNISIKFCEEQIHFDDSIGTIKLKILNEIKKEVSLDEIYLYCQRIETLNAAAIYQSLTQKNKLDLTKVRFDQFISNIVSGEDGKPLIPPADKNVYTFDDIFEMKFDNKKYIVNKVLGQKFFIVENEYPFVCNPYKVTEYDKLLERSARKSLTTLNSHLLLNTGDIVDNSIYLCLAEDVLDYLAKKDISEETTMKIYYPFLYNKNIINLDQLENNRNKLIQSNKKVLNEKTVETFKTIDMFYDVYNLRKKELNYVNKGIKYIKAVLRPDFYIKIPLEVIFKIVHATKDNPLIKYNPSSRQENVYRFFTDKIATDGRKIPYIKKASFFKLKKTIARNKSVAVYIESNAQTLICEFDEEGFITLTSEFDTAVSVNEINEIFKNYVNPIILEIKDLLEQSGYKLNVFNSLDDENVEIKQMTYETQIEINKPLDIDAYKGCLSSIFINETNSFKSGNDIHLRFKRVANYSVFTSQEAFILEKSGQGLRGDQIIEALLENFPNELTRKDAEEMVRKIANELEIERGVRKSDIKIKNNPGFKTVITLEKETGIITIRTENINNINYLYSLPIYLDTMVRLTQDKGASSNYPVKEIHHLCSTGEKHDVMIADMISSSEESAPNSEIPSIEPGEEEVQYNTFKNVDVNKPKGALSLFFDDDDNEQEDESFEGGRGSDSESSISSEADEESEEGEKLAKPTYDGITVPSGLSSSESESSVSSVSSAKEESEKEPQNLSSIKSDTVNESEKEEVKTVIAPDSEDIDEDTKSVKLTVDKEEGEDEGEHEGEDENEDEEEESEDEADEEETVRNIDGMKLNKPYYFQTLIEKKDPVLILKEDTPQFNSYPRTCSSNMRRQPVIITDEQLDKINKEHPGFLREEDVVKYGSTPKKQFNYICPRYWCLKNNTFVHPNDLKEVTGPDGKKELVHPTCGKVLPKGEKVVKPGYYIYEFYQPKPGKKDYKKYPSLIPDSHPDGYCLPCCFDKYNTEGRINAMKKCKGQTVVNKEKGEPEEKQKKVEEKEKEEDEYIKGPDKFPLKPGRWGYLPVEIQTMLHEVNADCQISKTNTNIKDNHPCLLRHGIEVNVKQSFIACISDVIFFGKRIFDENHKITNKIAKILTIKEMRDRIIKAISLDSFIKYQNGNLVTDFNDLNKKIDLDEYKDTKLFSKIDMGKPEDKIYFTKVASAYENFINFLKDDDVVIDHTYLWDIISMPNKYLFPNGVNLVILHLPKDDITNNVQLLCPTNHYSSEFYDSIKPTIILMKEDGYYEPIYSYSTNNKKISVSKEFKERDPQLSKTMRAVFKEIIKPFFNLICRPLESMPNMYKAKRPLLLYDLVQKLDKYEYDIQKLVVNFNNKVIGVFAQEPAPSKKQGFIPCYPSSINDNLKKDLDFVFMTDVTLWNTYVDTVQFLNKLDRRSKKRRNEPDIPCKPAFKVVEDEHVVGILTNTNQFIQLSQPIRLDEVDEDLNLPSLDNDNYIVNVKDKPMVNSDVEIMTRTDIDKERVDYIKKIKLETNFYNVFRNTIRILINDYENVKIREKIEGEMLKEYIIYSEKLVNIEKLLRELVKDKIQFIGDENYYKLINEISTCIVKDKEACSATPNLCVTTENDKCNLILPEKNLITHKKNEPIYFGRMADELIRYNRIKSFMLQPQTYLSFGNISYNLRDNEIILIESLLTKEYFETLIPAVTNKYITHNSYDEVQPILTQVYENKISSLDQESIIKKSSGSCEKTFKKHITSGIWKDCFPENYGEIEYSKNIMGTYTLIIDLIERKTTQKLTVNQIKNELFNEYKKYLGEYLNKIVDILILEGKKTLGDQVRSEILSFASLIYTDNYFLTPFDLWLLVIKYEIPTIFVSQTYILQAKYEKQEFVAYTDKDENEKYAFIVIPGLRPENIPGFKLIQSNEGEVFISLDKLNNNCVERIRNDMAQTSSVENYLKNFTKPTKTKYEKKKPKRLLIESDSEDSVIVKKKPEKKIIKEDIEISPEEFVIKPAKKSRKKLEIKGNPGTRKIKK